MKASARTQYWDSGVIVSFFNAKFEPERAKIVRALLEDAEAGRLEITTSSFALVEVLKVDREHPLTKEAEDKVAAFFEKPYIHLINADRMICEQARHLIWRFGTLRPKDSVHMGSALAFAEKRDLDALFSWDTDFTKLDGKITKKFKICQPYIESPSLEDWARSKSGEQTLPSDPSAQP